MVVNVAGMGVLAKTCSFNQARNLALPAVLPFGVNERSHDFIQAELAEGITGQGLLVELGHGRQAHSPHFFQGMMWIHRIGG